MTQAQAAIPRPARLRGYAAVIVSNIFFGLSIGMFLPLLPLKLDQMGVSAFWIGVNAAASSCAIFFTAPFIGMVLNRLGYTGAVLGGAVVYASGPLRVEITDEVCRDAMSGQPYSHTVVVTEEGEGTYRGCGRPLVPGWPAS